MNAYTHANTLPVRMLTIRIRRHYASFYIRFSLLLHDVTCISVLQNLFHTPMPINSYRHRILRLYFKTGSISG